MKKIFTFLFLIFFGARIFAQSASADFARGEELFKQNKSSECLEYLQRACDAQTYPKAFIYLSLAYFQTGDYSQALEVCQKGMKVSGTDKKVLALNAGNVCFVAGDYKEAEQWYSKAIAANPLYSRPVLNRANARLRLENYAGCIVDYKKYLELEPDDVQRPEIERLLAMLEQELERQREEEEARLAEEERLREEERRLAEQMALEEERRREEERIAAEKAAAEREALRLEQERLAQEEAERRRKLLEDVASSLQNTETENMSAGAEGTFDYGYETELE